MADPAQTAKTSTTRYPPQIAFIIGNEGCERFSYYGMRNILTVFMVQYLLLNVAPHLRKPTAQANYHLFVSAAYFTPLLGGWLSDRFLGKYRTILYLSLVYCVGHALLAVSDVVRVKGSAGWYTPSPSLFYLGLGLIALGSGGIKPCVSAHVGDQFTETNKHLTKSVFQLFYWIINFGSFAASALIPKTLEWWGPGVAFGIPGVLMLLATIVFWMGRTRYVHVPPTGKNPHSFFRVVASALRNERPAGSASFLDAAKKDHPESAVDGVKAVLSVLLVLSPIPIFWSLFDQKGSSWILQATQMNLKVGKWTLAASQLSALNPAMVMLLIPLMAYVVYPAFERRRGELSRLSRMTAGIFIASLSFVIVAVLQVVLDRGLRLSVLWQTIPYLVLTLAEVLVSTTGLEFAYSQAPREMKSTVMSLWSLMVTVGNLITALVLKLDVFKGATQFLFYASLAAMAGIAFWLLSRKYVSRDYFQGA